MPIRKTIAQQKKEVLRQILKFYNDKGNWTKDGWLAQSKENPYALEKDNGRLAALGEKLIQTQDEQTIKKLLRIISEKLLMDGVGPVCD